MTNYAWEMPWEALCRPAVIFGHSKIICNMDEAGPRRIGNTACSTKGATLEMGAEPSGPAWLKGVGQPMIRVKG